jgi:ATP-dependent Zn protease
MIITKPHRIQFLLLICALASPSGLLAAEEQVRQHSAAIESIYAILPFVIIVGILWWFLRKSQRSPFMRRSLEYYERSEQHMQRMEQIGERIAATLEKRDKDTP